MKLLHCQTLGTATDKTKACTELYGGAHNATRQKPILISIGYRANFITICLGIVVGSVNELQERRTFLFPSPLFFNARGVHLKSITFLLFGSRFLFGLFCFFLDFYFCLLLFRLLILSRIICTNNIKAFLLKYTTFTINQLAWNEIFIHQNQVLLAQYK